MPCQFCDALGPMKQHHILPASVLHPVLKADPAAFPTSLWTDATFTSLSDAANLGCEFCTIIRDGILAFADRNEVVRITVSQNIEHRANEDLSNLGHLYPLRVAFTTSTENRTELIFYTANNSVTKLMPHFTTAAHVSADPSSAECLFKASRWLDHCMQNHGPLRCPLVAGVDLPTRVICVGDELTDPYLYESKPGEKGVWAALSYCWGKSQVLTTTMASLPIHKFGFALSAVPKTCRDAIFVARALSIPHLWIDALCIVQDSSADWQREAARMCYIYENAIVTLAAPQSASSDEGLFLPNPGRGTVNLEVDLDGQTGVVHARRALSNPLFQMHKHRADPPNQYVDPEPILETRAWTLQELMLSPRILWFGTGEIGWSCWSSTACECEPEQTFEHLQHDEDNDVWRSLKISSSPSHTTRRTGDWSTTWCELVQRFTTRDLTVSTDRLPAMSGLASASQTHIKSEYLAGLWGSALTTQLLWISLWLALPHHNGFPPPLDDDYAPSWSWASVTGQVRFPNKSESRGSNPIWQILSVDFRHIGLNQFGRGEGSITIDSYLLPVQWADDQLTWISAPDKHGYTESILFAQNDSVLWDPRSRTWDLSRPAYKRYWFLAGSLYRNLKGEARHCKGIVLELLPDMHTFMRLGYAEPKFNVSGTGSWEAWKQRCTWTTVKIV